MLRDMGVEPVVVDVFDVDALSRLLSELRPETVIPRLTDLPYALEAGPKTESDPLLPVTHPVYGATVQGVLSLESQVLAAPLDGIVLRCGLFYGPGTGFEAPIAPGAVHVDAAARVAETDGAASSEAAISAFGWNPG